MYYLLYLSAVGEDVDLVQNRQSELLYIQWGPNNRLESFPVLSFHARVTQISDHRQLEEWQWTKFRSLKQSKLERPHPSASHTLAIRRLSNLPSASWLPPSPSVLAVQCSWAGPSPAGRHTCCISRSAYWTVQGPVAQVCTGDGANVEGQSQA